VLQAVVENVNREHHYPVKCRKDRNNLALKNRKHAIYMVQESVQISEVHTPGLTATSCVQIQDLHNLL